jgi:AcrR family transcriptional regulator
MPRTKEQFEDMRYKSKNLIIDVATKLFANRGYHSTSMNRIAKEAGVAIGLTYNYFTSKEDLLKAIMVKSMDTYNEHMMEISGEAMDNNDLPALIEAAYVGVCSETETWLLFIRAMTEVRGIDFSDLTGDAFFDQFEDIALAYYTKAGVSEPEEKAYLISEMVYGMILSFVISQDLESFERTKNNLIRYVLG